MTTVSVNQTRNADIRALLAARGLRGFGDGFAVIVLPAYLAALGLTSAQIGFVATAALLGTAVLTFAVGFVGARYELRSLFLAGAALIVVTGLAFANVETIALILAVAFIGTLNPSAGDLGMLVPLEHTALTREARDRERTRVFAHYNLVGSLSTAAGSLAAALPDLFVRHGLTEVSALKAMFYVYALIGIAATVLYQRLPRDHAHASAAPRQVLPQSRGIVYKLAALFCLDAFAGGFAVQSLLVLWLFERFELSLAAASVFFLWSNLLSALSFPVAAWLSARIGLVNTMVYTHIPASLCMILVAFAPNLTLALALLLLRSPLSQMDVPTRSSYVMAVVAPDERTAAASFTAVPRSLASSISPAISGFLLAGSFSGLPLVLCGALKIVYDVILLYSFRHLKPPEEKSL